MWQYDSRGHTSHCRRPSSSSRQNLPGTLLCSLIAFPSGRHATRCRHATRICRHATRMWNARAPYPKRSDACYLLPDTKGR